MNKIKELHIVLDSESVLCCDNVVYSTYCGTEIALLTDEIVFTTQTAFLSFRWAERLFVHRKACVHEITIGDCEGTTRFIREGHNLEKMLISGEFDWF